MLVEQYSECPETPNKTCENWEEEVRKIIRNNLDMTDDIEIDHCHRMGKFLKVSKLCLI